MKRDGIWIRGLSLLMTAAIAGRIALGAASDESSDHEIGDGRAVFVSDGYADGTVPTSARPADAAPAFGVSAASAILIDQTGEILYQKDPDRCLPMASTTKIMTALLAIEAGGLDREVAVPPEAVGIEGSSAYLTAGETVTMETLLYALLLASANDAATAIAILTAGSEAAFVSEMNRKAEALGLTDTSFDNPHGLDGAGHYTTARDLSRLTARALTNETFRAIVSTERKAVPRTDTEGTRVFVNHNRLLRSYPGCVGVKTGYTKRSGRCLVTAAERDGLTLIAVTLNAPDDWRDHKAMLDYGFSVREAVPLTVDLPREIPIVGGSAESVALTLTGPADVVLPKGDHAICAVCELRRFYYAPVGAGEILGRVIWYDGEKAVASGTLTASETVERKPEKSFWVRFKDWLFGP